MIKIDRIPETVENEQNISKEYVSIKPVESMSNKEMSDFIDAEFQKAHDEADVYDRLLTDTFNRSEEELDIDFTIGDQLASILENFKDEKWAVLDGNEQMEAIKELADSIGKELDLQHFAELSVADGENSTYGVYIWEKNEIVLNSRYFDDPKELVNTIAHEMRHAYQHMRAEMLETWEDVLYQFNFENYINPMPLPAGGYLFFTDYQDQYVEVDARVFANKFTEAMS